MKRQEIERKVLNHFGDIISSLPDKDLTALHDNLASVHIDLLTNNKLKVWEPYESPVVNGQQIPVIRPNGQILEPVGSSDDWEPYVSPGVPDA